MMRQTKDRLVSDHKNINVADTSRDKNTTDSSLSSTGKPIAVWESPEFEEFDLCMEVTAYVHQWK